MDLTSGSSRGYFYEDFELGLVMHSGARTITEHDIISFAGMTGDFSPIHMDAEFSKASPFGERIAHGLLGLVIAQGLVALTGHIWDSGVASLSWRNWEFKAPIRIGDTLRVRWTVTEKRKSRSQPGLGLITEFIELVNQNGAIVQQGEHVTLLKRRQLPTEHTTTDG